MSSIKAIEKLSAPVLVALALALLAWAVTSAGGFGPMLSAPSRLATAGQFWAAFVPSVTAQARRDVWMGGWMDGRVHGYVWLD